MTPANLGQGLHFVRVAYVNDLPNNSRDVTMHELRTTGGHWSNENSDANALAAASTVIAHYRRGPATIALAGGTGTFSLVRGKSDYTVALAPAE